MTAVVGIVSLIFVGAGLATATILESILQENLNTQVVEETPDLRRVTATSTAADVLDTGRQTQGYLLILQVPSGLTGAYVTEDADVAELTSEQLSVVVAALDTPGFVTIDLPELGEYRLDFTGSPSGLFAAYGLPTSEVTSTLGTILTSVTLVTVGGLILLGVVIVLVIRRSLRPLRAVADTAQRVARMPLAEGSVRISERVPPEQSDPHTEIGSVGDALNTLLDHVDASLEERQRNEERMRRFVADASHELRTPLASIRGYSELSLRAIHQGNGAEAVANTETSLERIQAQSLRMTALVEDLLLLARLEEGQELVYGAVDLSRLAIETLGDAQAAGRDHTWEIELGDEPIVVAGDEPRLHQVVVNLLANARTHTPAGTTVTLSVAGEGTEAVVRVHDNGPGVDPTIMNELFERFARADSSRARKTGGTGLGLSIARAIVDAHSGSISVASTPGDTTFTVRLPARPDTPAAADPAQ
ncbi:two-component system OmpR family sensor kinase [Microbacterium endophyticum]|uniref:histidine kinase n=1 Tax=Microbacterium endophyticum TaxID=1526412 RepID=A0A7W4V107_9MICO|nr:HAMP domain-containing sensor histidine kinase [Microbacterium endophyticum]MBB2974878.1 two-component system OmpR family sensor kinase [Microbacterium endophyticum]NIK37175.1 two-component system OmpR family sensor kinase [Microbacterium endophyticum]